MKKTANRISLLAVTVVATVVGFFMRRRQVLEMVDTEGLWKVGAGAGPLTWYCLAMVILAGVCAWTQTPRKKYGLILSREPLVGIVGILAGCLPLAGIILQYISGSQQTNKLYILCTVAASLSWIALSVLRWGGKRPPETIWMIPVVCFIGKIILDFRVWSTDPEILDYCFELFALISLLCFQFHLAGFPFQQGRNRLTVFFGLTAVFFCVISAADLNVIGILNLEGGMVWTVCNLWLLLRPGRKREEQ